MNKYSIRREELESILHTKLRLKKCLSVNLYSIYSDGFGINISFDDYKFGNIAFDKEADKVKLITNSYNEFNFDNFEDRESIDNRNMRAVFFISELILSYNNVSTVIREFIVSEDYLNFIEDFRKQ